MPRLVYQGTSFVSHHTFHHPPLTDLQGRLHDSSGTMGVEVK